MNIQYDLIIIGAGPSGIACAIEAHKAGLNYLILEKGVLVNSIYHFPDNMQFFSTSVNLEIGDVPFISHRDKPSRFEALEYYRRLVSNYQLNIQYDQEVVDLRRMGNLYKINCQSNSFETISVVLATGFYDTPSKLNVPGEELDKVKHYYDDAHLYIGRKIIVVGGANSACDVALETWQKGAEVTMVVRNSTLYEKVKYWILPNVQNRIKEGSIKAYFNSTIRSIDEKSVHIRTPNGLMEMENDFVLAMTGYRPNYDFFDRIGIKYDASNDKLPLHNPQTLESNLENVYLSGVILGGLQTSKLFIENTREHGKIIVSDILSKRSL